MLIPDDPRSRAIQLQGTQVAAERRSARATARRVETDAERLASGQIDALSADERAALAESLRDLCAQLHPAR
jgi:hypothetical protein